MKEKEYTTPNIIIFSLIKELNLTYVLSTSNSSNNTSNNNKKKQESLLNLQSILKKK